MFESDLIAINNSSRHKIKINGDKLHPCLADRFIGNFSEMYPLFETQLSPPFRNNFIQLQKIVLKLNNSSVLYM